MTIVFLDFEASSLTATSWPVEIGWAVDGGFVESHLLKPEPTWEDWDAAAQAVHGLSREHLREHGELADLVARLAVDVLDAPGAAVFSDAPGWEQAWLDKLLREAGLPCRIRVQYAGHLYRAELRRLLALAPPPMRRWHDHVVKALELEAGEMLQDVYAAELTRDRVRHRAGPDAEGLRWVLEEVRSRVDARLAAAK